MARVNDARQPRLVGQRLGLLEMLLVQAHAGEKVEAGGMGRLFLYFIKACERRQADAYLIPGG